MCLQNFFAEAGANFADGLKFFGVGVVAGEKECPVNVGSFSFAIVAFLHCVKVCDVSGQVLLTQPSSFRGSYPKVHESVQFDGPASPAQNVVLFSIVDVGLTQ